jgi:NAD(P)H-flavin reductase
VAGGTGISFALPLVLEASESEKHKTGLVQLVWVVRRARDLAWVKEEMGELRARAAEGRVEVMIFVTREGGPMEVEEDEDEVMVVEAKDDEKLEAVVDVKDENPKTEVSVPDSTLAEESRGFSVTYLGGTHPDLGAIVQDYIERSPASGGRIQVMASGPAGIGSTLRSVVAKCNDGRKVGRGEEKSDVGLYWDDRFL